MRAQLQSREFMHHTPFYYSAQHVNNAPCLHGLYIHPVCTVGGVAYDAESQFKAFM